VHVPSDVALAPRVHVGDEQIGKLIQVRIAIPIAEQTHQRSSLNFGDAI
jgi:hypothetical protein